MDKQIEEIMDNFNFNKVHRVMVSLGWVYAMEGVPTLESIKKTALGHLKHVKNTEDCISIESGGFRASIKEGEGQKYLILQFIVASWDTEK